ncbi:MAG: hypothetical protein BWY83_00240 [bacterium ADurb.Bin478]|nr:MAG: hypothetical protein BWY83_00240 [bacterium ADurb.Bin478]
MVQAQGFAQLMEEIADRLAAKSGPGRLVLLRSNAVLDAKAADGGDIIGKRRTRKADIIQMQPVHGIAVDQLTADAQQIRCHRRMSGREKSIMVVRQLASSGGIDHEPVRMRVIQLAALSRRIVAHPAGIQVDPGVQLQTALMGEFDGLLQGIPVGGLTGQFGGPWFEVGSIGHRAVTAHLKQNGVEMAGGRVVENLLQIRFTVIIPAGHPQGAGLKRAEKRCEGC